MDSDGTRAGFDCELTAAVSSAVRIPVIASGGAGTVAHFADVFGAGKADAALAASIFHFGVSSARSLKQELAQAGIPVRLPC
jgi:cyclase